MVKRFQGYTQEESYSVPPTTMPAPKPPCRQIPNKYNDIVSSYKIFTKEDYKRYRLSGMETISIRRRSIEHINEKWERIRGEYNFIIAVGQGDNLTFYSVDYFNNNILK